VIGVFGSGESNRYVPLVSLLFSSVTLIGFRAVPPPHAIPLFERLLKRRGKRREIVAHDLPQDVEVDRVVAVNQTIPQADDLRPRNIGMANPFLCWHPACRFAQI
jgi:hypothetical protein